jgi:PKD domain
VAADSHKPTNVYGLSGQYADASGPAAYASTFQGSVLATDPLPPNDCIEPLGPPLGTGPGWSDCVIDADLQAEVDHVVASHHLPRSAHEIYFLVMPNGLGSCIDTTSRTCALGGNGIGYCGYHDQTVASILYAVIPYNAVDGHCQSGNPRPNSSTADPAISTLSHEHNEMVTDPYADAWVDAANNEDGDLCFTQFGPALGGSSTSAWNELIHGRRYWLQEEWSNDDASCQPRDEADAVSMSARGRIAARKKQTFTGHASDPDGRIVAYTWYFGSGSIGRRRVVTHVFKRPGTYRVVLRVTDGAGNYAFASRTVRVTPSRKH